MFGSKINPSDAKADLGDDIANSAVFDDGSSQYFSRAFTGADSLKTFCIHVIFRRGNHGLTDTILVDTGTTGTKNRLSLSIDPLDRLVFIWGTQILITTNKLRDTGWYHVTLRCDSTQATAADRASIEINNVEATYTTDNRAASMAQNSEAAWGESGATGYIGAYSTPSNYWDGLMALHYYIDGDDSVVFGRYSTTHTTVWVYAAPSPTYGTGGHKLAFETGGNLGDDTSGNTNDWTNNGGVTQSTDTPTNVFCTLSTVNAGPAMVLSEGNQRVSAGASNSVGGTLPLDGMLAYWEVEAMVTPNNGVVGIGRDFLHTANFVNTGIHGIYYTANNWYSDGSNSTSPTHAAISSGDRLMFAFDEPNGKLFIGLNGTWLNSGDPAAGTGAIFTGLTQGGYLPYFGTGTVPTNDYRFGFGQDDANIASAVSDGNGYGSFEYTPPTGFLAICQANLPNVITDLGGIDKPNEHFAVVTDTEANVEATLAAALAPTDYVDVLKNRDASETWAWQFSHDGSNEHAVGTTDTYGAKRALAGSNNWLGARLKIASGSGTAAGAQAHTNGAGDTTVTHGLTSSRYAILLFPRAGGDVFYYHPDLTSGNLLKLNTTAGQAALTRIKNVTTTSFDIESAAPTDTYDYLTLAKTPGLIDLGIWTGNASTDGTQANLSGSPLWLHHKKISGVANHYLHNAVSNPYNVLGEHLRFDLPNIESTFTAMDFLSNGVKIRTTNGDFNGSAATYVYISIAYSAIGGGIPYPNAR